jgi:hypothetical protein
MLTITNACSTNRIGEKMHDTRTRSRTLCAAAALTTVLTLGGATVAAGPANAGLWMQASCVNPDGSAAGSDGWTTFKAGGPPVGSVGDVNCSPTKPMYAALSSRVAAAGGSSENLRYTTPSGSTLAGGQVLAGLSADGFGKDAAGVAAVLTPRPTYDQTNLVLHCVAFLAVCQNNTFNHFGVLDLPRDRGGELFLSALCVARVAGAVCDSGGSHSSWALVAVHWARLLLDSPIQPTATGFTGGLLAADAHGTTNLAFGASDPGGPGVYNVNVMIDGQSVYNATPDKNAGRCVATGTDGPTGALVFGTQQPCPQNVAIDVPVPTTNLPDGEHQLAVTVQNAAKNTVTVLNQVISVNNRTDISARLSSELPPTAKLTLNVKALGNSRLRFTGRLTAKAFGNPRPLVFIQARKGDRWQAVGPSVRIGRTGRFNLVYNSGGWGIGSRYSFRAVAPKTAQFGRATSRIRKARIR